MFLFSKQKNINNTYDASSASQISTTWGWSEKSGWSFFEFKTPFLNIFWHKNTKKHPKNLNKLIYQFKTLINWFKKYITLAWSAFSCKMKEKNHHHISYCSLWMEFLDTKLDHLIVRIVTIAKCFCFISFFDEFFFLSYPKIKKINQINFIIKIKIIVNLELTISFFCVLHVTTLYFNLVWSS